MNIVLVEPQIPQNTGNIARLCAATGSRLYLVGKLGFRTDNKYLKRAGLDYWKDVEIFYFDSFEKFEESCLADNNMHLMTTKSESFYSDVSYNKNDYLIFGSETTGLAVKVRDKYVSKCLKIPMSGKARSLNLANSVGIVLFEALRQSNFSSYRLAP